VDACSGAAYARACVRGGGRRGATMSRTLALLVLMIFAFPAASGAQSLVLVAKHSGKCAQVNGASHDNGAKISQWDCVDQPNVHWRKVHLGDGQFYLMVRHSGKCAQVVEASHANGAAVTQWDCVNQRNVKWRQRPAGGGYVYLVNRESGKCMQVNDAANTNGAIISQWDCVDQDNVKWKVTTAR
jgi:ricin-type beta-trefoil lectin protein